MKSQSAVWSGNFLLVVLVGAVALAASPKPKVAVTISEVDALEALKAPRIDGLQARAISVAYMDFERRGHEIAGYDVIVLRRPDDFVVYFEPRIIGDDQRVGNAASGPGFAYAIAKDGRLLKLQFSR